MIEPAVVVAGWRVTAVVISGEALACEPVEWIFSEAAVVWYFLVLYGCIVGTAGLVMVNANAP